jgi:hypothetical protein
MPRRGANPLLKANPTVTLGFRVSVAVAEQMRRLLREKNCSIPALFADGLNAIEAQKTAPNGESGGLHFAGCPGVERGG